MGAGTVRDKGLRELETWLLGLRRDDPDFYCGFELDFGMDRSQVLDKIQELLRESNQRRGPMRLENMRIMYDGDGRVVAINQDGVDVGISDFGDGQEPATRPANESLGDAQISTATRSAVQAMVIAFDADLAVEQQRIVEDLQRVADDAAARALEAQGQASDAATDAGA